ncbi:MAG TPA: RluA family pseudouridine synthase [Dehalococcoidia bacterium]|nr:RluA family pseudouridine synthase [Dehalococcoidia bacterium]
MQEEIHELPVEVAGERLDKYIATRLPSVSRSFIQKLIDGDKVTVNNRAEKAGFKLSAGDRIIISIPEIDTTSLKAEPIPLDIIYEDSDLLVIDKPAGLTVHPAPGHPGHTLVNAVLSYFPELADSGGERLRPGIVHRLDKDTSGLVIVAKNRESLANLSEQFKSRSVTKNYLTLVKGHIKPETGLIEANLGRDKGNRKRMAITENGKEARTRYRVVTYYNNGYSLLEITLETGRTHQIRVHLAAIGFPVLGDTTYGIKSPFLTRQFLHANRIGFYLPSTGKYIEFQSELPDDLKQVLEKIA